MVDPDLCYLVVALSLAICELKAASAHDELVPMECAAFASEGVDLEGVDPRACTQYILLPSLLLLMLTRIV